MSMQPGKAPAITGEWECTECGYIVEGTETRRPAQCPECDAPASAMEFYAYEGDDDWEEDEDELGLLDDLDDEDLYEDDLIDEDDDEDDL